MPRVNRHCLPAMFAPLKCWRHHGIRLIPAWYVRLRAICGSGVVTKNSKGNDLKMKALYLTRMDELIYRGSYGSREGMEKRDGEIIKLAILACD